MKIFANVFSYSQNLPVVVEVNSADLVEMWSGAHLATYRTASGVRHEVVEDRYFFHTAAGAAHNDPADRFFSI